MSLTRTRRLSLFAALVATLLMLQPISPAAASQDGPGAFTVAGQAALDGGIGTTGTGCFAGYAVGAHAHDTAVDAAHLVTQGLQPNARASVAAYDNTQLALGTANGTLTITGTEVPSLSEHSVSVGYTWLRVGATAVLTFADSDHTGAAVAAFVPTTTVANPALPACRSSAGLFATVAGAGVIAAL